MILPVSAMFDDAPLAVSCQDTPVRYVRSKRTARTEKSLFAGSISAGMSSKTRATANTSVRVHSCLASDEIQDSMAAARDPGGDEHRWTWSTWMSISPSWEILTIFPILSCQDDGSLEHRDRECEGYHRPVTDTSSPVPVPRSCPSGTQQMPKWWSLKPPTQKRRGLWTTRQNFV